MSRSRGRDRVPAGAREDRAARWLGIVCGALFLVRFLVPAESADAGDTLWIVALWLATAAVAAWWGAREGRFTLRLGRVEAAVVVIALGHIVSAAAVLIEGGQRRAAVNIAWEWVGIATAFVLLRQVFARRRTGSVTTEAGSFSHEGRRTIEAGSFGHEGRRRLAAVIVTSGILLSGLAVWQRYVWYPAIVDDYLEFERLSQGAATGGESLVRQRRLEELRRSLGPELLSFDGPQRLALRQRVLFSTEPFGRFALANTLGGTLAVVLVLLAGGLMGTWREASAARRGLGVALTLWVAYGLLLTKGRTAWVGAVAGLAVVIVLRGRRTMGTRRWVRAAIAAAAVVAPAVAVMLVASFTGIFDRQVLSEAPKSLLYRLQYWTGAWGVIADHPVLGAGPGNFGPHYLRYKLPEASEEIADPHNLFLDAWSSGGLIALAGLAWLLWLAVRMVLGQRSGGGGQESGVGGQGSGETLRGDGMWLAIVGLLGCGLTLAAAFLLEARWDEQVLILAVAWLPAGWLTLRLMEPSRSQAALVDLCDAGLGAGTALAVHLCGAGGMEMPAVVLLLLATWFVVASREPAGVAAMQPKDEAAWRTQRRRGFAVGAACLTLLLVCLWTAWLPVSMARLQLQSGNYESYETRNMDRAIGYFEKATEADQLDPEPWRSLSLARLVKWQSARDRSEEDFQKGVAAARSAIERDPHNPHLYRLLGSAWMRREESSGREADAAQAVEAYRQAVERYPHSAATRSELVEALLASGDSRGAAEQAGIAIWLDDFNHRAAHFDKLLSPETRAKLETIAQGPAAPSSG